MPVPMSGMPLPGALVKPKRKQVKMACTNCAAACKRCDVSRPCERCVKYGLSDTCRDGQRKERKKGFKRAAQNNPNGEWTPNGPNGTPFPGPPPQGSFPPPPEGYYPAFYTLAPPPPGPGPQLVPVAQSGSPNDHPVEGQAEVAIDPNANNQNGDNSQVPHGQPSFPPPHAQFVYPPLPPGSYPPFGYPFPGPPHQQQQHQQPQTEPEPSSNSKTSPSQEDTKEDDEDDPPTPPRKKRGRRNSDGEWPGATKRATKAKLDTAPPTRRSTRRQQHPEPEGGHAGTGDGHDGNLNAVTESIIEQNVVTQSAADPIGNV
ncbi:hypothetical protein K439DRAFT_991969 [Ramaria rubella]|nr:hypothetical protein K439DRAFT_991969 [Ramaria rubella]